MASLLSFAKGAINTVKNDVVAPVERDVVQPVAHAASTAYNTGFNAVSHVPVVGAPLAAADRGTVNFAASVPKVLGGIGNTSLQDALHGNNNPATQNAMAARNRAETTFGSSVFRPLAQAAETVVHPATQHSYTPTLGNAQRLLGKTPVQNINKGVASNYSAHPNLNPVARIGLAGAYGAGQVAQDVGTVAGLKYGLKGAEDTAKANVKPAYADDGTHGSSLPPKSPAENSTPVVGKNAAAQVKQGSEQLANRAHSATLKDGGVTIDSKGNVPTKGFSYAPNKTTEVAVPTKDFETNPELLANYVKEHQAELSKPGNHLGTWTNPEDGNTYMDISRVGSPSTKTIAEAQAAKQLSVYDLEHGNTIDTGKIDANGLYSKNGTPSNISNQYQRQISGASSPGSNSSTSQIRQDIQQTRSQLGSKAPQPPQVGLKTNKFVNTVKKSDEVSAPVKAEVANSYKPGSNAEKLAQSGATVSSGLDKATEQVNSALAKPRGTINAQDVSDAIATAKAHDAAGNVDTATQIYNKLADHLTAAAQTVQAASLLARRSPEGLRNAAISALQKGGANITDDLKNKVQTAYNNIKNTPEDSNERAYAVQDLQKIINNNTKSGKVNQAFTLWRTGLLAGPLTATKVAASHLVLNAAEKVKDIPAVALDKMISGASRLIGKGPMRSTALTLRGTAKGTAEGLKAAGQLLGHGHETPGTSGIGGSFDELGKPTVTYGNSIPGKAANLYTQKVGQVHASIPKPFYMAAKENDLYKQADAAAINKGLTGSAKRAFVKDFIKNQTPEVGSEADLAGQKAAFQQPSFLGRQAQALQNVPGGRAVLPFAKIAATILTDVKDYSPVGAAQSIFDAAKASKNGWSPILQKQLVEGVGRGITGTAVVALGAELAKKGAITTNYPTDKKEQALWQAEGKQENSIKVNGEWRQTPSLGPFASLLQAGAYYEESKGTNPAGKSNATAALTGALSNFSSQSYLSGLTSVAGAVQNPTENLGSTAKLEAGSVIPTGVAQIAAAGDKYDRTTQNAGQAIESKIPGLREKLPVAQTQFGQPIANPTHGITGVTDPTKPTNAVTNDPVTNELQRLVSSVGTSATPVPQPVTKISGTGANGASQHVPLSKTQQAQFTSVAGPQIHSVLSNMIDTPGYKALDDNAKAAALTNAKTLTENSVKTQAFNQLSGNPKGSITGSAAANLNTKNVATAAVQKAKVAADKANFTTSGSSFETVDNTVFTKDAAGNVTSTPITTYQYNLGTATLTQQKDNGDLAGWLSTANNQVQLIQKQLNDPTINVDPLQVLKLQNQGATLQTDIAKYTADGGFSSSSSGYGSTSSSAQPKVQNYKTSGGSTVKAPKFKAISTKGSSSFKSPHVAKAKTSTGKLSFKSSKGPKAPNVGVKAVTVPNEKKSNAGYYS